MGIRGVVRLYCLSDHSCIALSNLNLSIISLAGLTSDHWRFLRSRFTFCCSTISVECYWRGTDVDCEYRIANSTFGSLEMNYCDNRFNAKIIFFFHRHLQVMRSYFHLLWIRLFQTGIKFWHFQIYRNLICIYEHTIPCKRDYGWNNNHLVENFLISCRLNYDLFLLLMFRESVCLVTDGTLIVVSDFSTANVSFKTIVEYFPKDWAVASFYSVINFIATYRFKHEV